MESRVRRASFAEANISAAVRDGALGAGRSESKFRAVLGVTEGSAETSNEGIGSATDCSGGTDSAGAVVVVVVWGAEVGAGTLAPRLV